MLPRLFVSLNASFSFPYTKRGDKVKSGVEFEPTIFTPEIATVELPLPAS